MGANGVGVRVEEQGVNGGNADNIAAPPVVVVDHSEELEMVLEEAGSEQSNLRERIKQVELGDGVGNGVQVTDSSNRSLRSSRGGDKALKTTTKISPDSLLTPEDVAGRSRKRKSTPPRD